MRVQRKGVTLCSTFVFVCVTYASLVSFAFDESIDDAGVTGKYSADLDVRHLDVPVASKQSPRRSLRLAFCVSGALRSLANERQRINFVDTFYKPFEPSLDDDKVSAIVHTFLCLDESVQARDANIMHDVIQALRPVDVEVASVTCDGSWCNDRNCIRSGYEQFKRFDMCMDRIIEREEEEGVKYDFIVRIRPDIVIHESLPRTHCWHNLRRDVIWDGDVQFFGGERNQFYFGDALREGTNRFVDTARNADSVSAFLNVIPRELAGDFMRGIARAYESCIPEVAHTDANLAIDGDRVLKKVFGDLFAGGCGRGNVRWRWDECRLLIQAQMMNASLGRIQVRSHTALARCRNLAADFACADAFIQLTGKALKNVTSRHSCFPADGYAGVSSNEMEGISSNVPTRSYSAVITFKERAALVDLDTSERLGGGGFAAQSGSMYETYDGYRLGKAERVKLVTRNLNNSYFHLEKQAFSVANFDWIMIDPKKSAHVFERISQRYGVLLITPGVMLTLPPRDAPFESKVIVYMDEPPDTTSFTDLRDRKATTLIKSVISESSRRGVCDRCVVSHFFTQDDATIHKYFPPLYDGLIFDALDRRDGQECGVKDSCAFFFFVQKRCAYADSIIEKLTLKGYEKLKGESWGEFSYADYFKNLRRARWIIALDPSLSAGQVIAEASLLGIPSFAFAEKPNARLLLPSELVVARNGSSEDIVKYVVDVIESYDSGRRSYHDLSMRIKEKALTKLTRFNRSALTQMFSACCDSRP